MHTVNLSAAGATTVVDIGRPRVCVIAASVASAASSLITIALGYAPLSNAVRRGYHMSHEYAGLSLYDVPRDMPVFTRWCATSPNRMCPCAAALEHWSYRARSRLHVLDKYLVMDFGPNWPSHRGSRLRYVPTAHSASNAVKYSPYRSGNIYSMTEPRPTVHIPIAVGLLGLLGLLSLGLLVRSMYYLGENRLTVEVQRDKYLRRLQKDRSPKAQSKYETMRPPCYRWDPDQQQIVSIPPPTPASWSLSHIKKLLGLCPRD